MPSVLCVIQGAFINSRVDTCLSTSAQCVGDSFLGRGLCRGGGCEAGLLLSDEVLAFLSAVYFAGRSSGPRWTFSLSDHVEGDYEEIHASFSSLLLFGRHLALLSRSSACSLPLSEHCKHGVYLRVRRRLHRTSVSIQRQRGRGVDWQIEKDLSACE